MTVETCRFCGAALKQIFCDLGMSPMSNAYLTASQLRQMEPFFPLYPMVCNECYLVQLPELQSPQEIFSDYAYFSSYSSSWLKHAETYVEAVTRRFGFDGATQVIEIGSNDGYLLQFFRTKGISVLGIEPAANVAAKAQASDIPTLVRFFGTATAQELVFHGTSADLLLGNNVLAHVPDINDFVAGMKILLKADGIITMEFPHLLRLIHENQFDTIYHEHFSYLSLLTTERIFAKHGLTLFDVEEIPTHGGSLRIYACHAQDSCRAISQNLERLKKIELEAGLNHPQVYSAFAESVRGAKRRLLEFLIRTKNQGKRIAAYGAPAKGNTLLNYCGVGTDFIDYTVDLSPYKQGLFLPGTRIPIHHPDKIKETQPDYLLILPWNIKDEIIEQMAAIREWGGEFVVPIPRIEVIP